ncbi:MAG: thioredoxin family protein [Luteibaculaceae bacterium]
MRLFVLLFLLSFGVNAQVTPYKKWDKAVEASKNENKDILIILTGKEWCAPCKKLENNVLRSSQFEDYAGTKMVVFEIDIPKSHLTRKNSAINKLHEEFSSKYSAKEFPSLILVNHEGKERLKITQSSWELPEVLQYFRAVYAND